MTSMIFERVEKKYLLTYRQKEQLLARIGERLLEDKYPHGLVASLYMDTPDYRCIRASMDARVYKEKLRLRAYGIPSLSDRVFLELKKKYKGVVYKRREKMTLAEAYRYLGSGIAPRQSQIFSEIGYVIDSTPDLAPRAYISYERDAFAGREESGLRITFDKNAFYRSCDLRLENGPSGYPVFPDESGIMEIKTLGAMPLWLADALDELRIFPTSFSKYGTAYLRYECGRSAAAPVLQEEFHA